MPSTPPTLIGELNGHLFYVPTSGGKAGAGYNRTSTIQVRKDHRILKQVRFNVRDPVSRQAAIRKAKAWAQAQPADATT